MQIMRNTVSTGQQPLFLHKRWRWIIGIFYTRVKWSAFSGYRLIITVVSLRDLQVNPEYQNKGIGAQALAEAKHLAIKSGAKKINLRVFKVSPAFHLYKRNGFTVSHDDDKFYYMEQQIA